MKILLSIGAVLLLAWPVHAQPLPEGSVPLQPTRWRAVRQVVQRCADHAGFRWAMPDTLSRRAWTGSAEQKELPVAQVLQDLCKQTGLTAEPIGGVLVFHMPKEAKRKELAALLASKDSRQCRQAISELAWLGDVRAWPELAKVAAAADVERALAASQALRRLEGERSLDWRLFGISNEDPEFVPMTEPAAAWQVPLGCAFPDVVSLEAIEKLAASPYIPLREAAARLAACQKAKGKALVEKLTGEPSPIVRAAAERTVAAWAEPKKGPPVDWANRLVFRYGGCTPCYSNECFGFDVGTATWFPVRAADHFCHLFNEVRPIGGCSRGMTYDGLNKWVWIGHAIGSYSGPTAATHNLGNCLGAYDAALDRFYPCANGATMAKAYSGEPAKFFAFDPDRGQIVASASGGKGVGVLDVKTRRTELLKAPGEMPSWDQYRPPAFAYDPVAKQLMCTHPDLGWKLLTYDLGKQTFRVAEAAYPGSPSKQIMGGLVYDCLNREMVLIGGLTMDKQVMPTCRYDRQASRWVDLQAKDLGQMGLGQGTCVYDPEHNVIIEVIRGVA